MPERRLIIGAFSMAKRYVEGMYVGGGSSRCTLVVVVVGVPVWRVAFCTMPSVSYPSIPCPLHHLRSNISHSARTVGSRVLEDMVHCVCDTKSNVNSVHLYFCACALQATYSLHIHYIFTTYSLHIQLGIRWEDKPSTWLYAHTGTSCLWERHG